MTRSTVRWALAGILLSAAPTLLRAQHDHHEMTDGSSTDHAMTESAMSATVVRPNPHMRMTPVRPASEADRRRAAAIVDTLRASLDQYRDVRVAESDGYKMFAPQIKNQPVYHYTNNWRAARAAFGFDPAKPTSLLYKKDAKGKFVLVGAMYTASARASLEELDARVPLSVARWHQHVDICVPKLRQKARWAERSEDGRMRFGPAGVIATKEECDAAGGRFLPRVFGWMVHANVFAGDDAAVIWGNHH